jgi:hypothetical protein
VLVLPLGAATRPAAGAARSGRFRDLRGIGPAPEPVHQGDASGLCWATASVPLAFAILYQDYPFASPIVSRAP